jgi:uncharacterized membrane protein (UPF0136 family)
MSLRNENIAIVVGVVLLVGGQLLAGQDASGIEILLIVIVGFGAAFGISDYLNERDRKQGLEPDRLPFRR